MKLVDFRAPTNVAEARALLKELGDRGYAVAGGTSLVFTPGAEERVAVDINRLGLEGIVRRNGSFEVGAATRLAALQKHREPGWVLDRVAVHLASQQIRNMSTLGGNIARVFPWADFPVALLALGATMVIAGAGQGELGADDYFASQPARLFKEGTLLTAVKIPAVPTGSGFGYRKEAQTSMGFSLVTAAALVQAEGLAVKSARVAIGAGVPFPCRVPAVEAALVGKKGSEALFKQAAGALSGLKFKGSSGMSEEYIAHLAEVVVADALTEAWAAAKGGAA